MKCGKKERQTFTLNYISYEEVHNEITNLQTAKVTLQNDIPTKNPKETSWKYLQDLFKKT